MRQRDANRERQILDLVEAEQQGETPAPPHLPMADVIAARTAAMAVHLSPPLRDYIVRLVTASRNDPFAADIDHAISPRGSLALAAAAKARAFIHGRDHALPADIETLAEDALSHRLVLRWRAVADGRTARDLVAEILRTTDAI